MNNKTRTNIYNVINNIEECILKLETIRDDEEDKMNNYPENLQGSEVYERMEEAVDSLDEAIDSLKDSVESLNEID